MSCVHANHRDVSLAITRYRQPWNSAFRCPLPGSGGPCPMRCLCCSSVGWPSIDTTRANDSGEICCPTASDDALRYRKSRVSARSSPTPLMKMQFTSISIMVFFAVHSAIESCSYRSRLRGPLCESLSGSPVRLLLTLAFGDVIYAALNLEHDMRILSKTTHLQAM